MNHDQSPLICLYEYTTAKPKFWALLRRLDIILFLLFIPVLYIVASQLTSPLINSPSLLWKIPLTFTFSLLTTDFLIRWLGRNKNSNDHLIISRLNRIRPQKITFYLMVIFSLVLTFLLLRSWGIAFEKYRLLFQLGTSSALRAITTSLHQLVPVESRLFYTVFPALLLYPLYSKPSFFWKSIFWTFMIFIGFVTTTKLSILYAVVFTAIYLWTKESFLKTKLKWPKILIPLLLIIFAAVFFKLIKQSGNAPETMLKKSYIPQLPPQPQALNPSLDKTKCEGKGDYDAWVQRGQAAFLVYRTFGISAEVLRLFICLRKTGWRPNFQGHQSARLIGKYKPYYRWAYGELRPGRGTSIGSAVSNVTADSFLNLGFPGVIASGIIIAILYNLLLWITQFSPYVSFSYLIRANFFLILCSGSILSALISFAPIVIILGFDFLITNWQSSRKRPSHRKIEC